MRWTGLPALVALCLFGAAHAAPPTLPAAEALVRAQYGPDADSTASGALHLYEPRLGRALTESSTAAGGDLGMDVRYGDSDWMVEDMTFTAAPTPTGATVTVRFLNFGKPVEIDWTIVPASDTEAGWRISDIAAPAQNEQRPWALRQLILGEP